MSSLQAPSTFWGSFLDFHVEAAYIVTGCASKRCAQVQVETIDGQLYVRMDKSELVRQAAMGDLAIS